MTHADKAEAIFAQGFNCAQAVFGAFAEEMGMDMAQAMRVASSLGGGLGGTGEVCGAALGMLLAIGMGKGYAQADMEMKRQHTERVKRLMEDFRAQYGDTSCNALREVGNRALCVGYVRYAAEQTEKALAQA